MSPNFLIVHPDNEIFEHTLQYTDIHLRIKYIHILLYQFSICFVRHIQIETNNIERNYKWNLAIFLCIPMGCFEFSSGKAMPFRGHRS